MPIKTMEDLYVNELKDLYSAEKQILKALPRMAKAASHPELRQAFQEHVAVTEEQVRRLETIFDELGKAPTFARELGYEEHAKILQQTLDEEGETDHRLTAIAEGRVNRDAEKR